MFSGSIKQLCTGNCFIMAAVGAGAALIGVAAAPGAYTVSE